MSAVFKPTRIGSTWTRSTILRSTPGTDCDNFASTKWENGFSVVFRRVSRLRKTQELADGGDNCRSLDENPVIWLVGLWVGSMIGTSRFTIKWIENRFKIPIFQWIVNHQFTFRGESIQFPIRILTKNLIFWPKCNDKMLSYVLNIVLISSEY